MSLSVSCTEYLRDTAEKSLPPLLLEHPSLQMQHSTMQQEFGFADYDDLVQDFFQLTNPCTNDVHYVLLPSGCLIMMFLLDTQSSGCFLCGPLSSARRFLIPARGTVFGMRLKGGSMDWILKQKAFTLTDQIVPLYKYRIDVRRLFEQVENLPTFHSRCAVLINFLECNDGRNYHSAPTIKKCIDLINQSHGTARVYELAAEIGRSERVLVRSFHENVGITVKTYCEIAKFQNSFYSIVTTHPRTLTNLARDCGYYDLPHMNRAFRKFVNYTANAIRYLDMREIYVSELFCDSNSLHC